MRKVWKKRVIYYRPWTQDVFYGGEEYDCALSDNNILGSIHTVGKTVWLYENDPCYDAELWLLRPLPQNPNVKLPAYKIEVEEFYIEVPTLWEKVFGRRAR